MANLKEIRIRIGSVSSTMQITSAMKMVSAAKLKKAQDAITAMRPYSNKLSELMQSFSGASAGGNKSYTENRTLNKVLVVVISSNRGLCGAFNANIAKEALVFKSKEKFRDSQIDFLTIPVKENKGSDNLDYIFEPSLESIANTLIPKSLKIQLFKAIRDSFASEHGARMTAMHKATDNASELRDELKLTYNKARQASITNEILEIVGGAEALNS